MAKDYVFTLLTSGENKRLRSIIPENDSITSPSTALVAREGTLDSLDEGCCCGTCEAQAKSGGAGVTINDYTFPKQQKTLEFRWQAYSVPDKFTVYFCDEEVFSWGPSPDGGRVLLLKPQGCRKVTVKVEGEDGTVWDYTLICYECLKCQLPPTTKTYSYWDSYPPGKSYGCQIIGQCVGPVTPGSCGNEVLNGHIIEKFDRVQLAGRAIKAKVKNNSRLDNEGSIGGIYTVNNSCTNVANISGDHDITDSLIIEDNDEDDCITAKIPIMVKNSNQGGPYGLAGVTIEWSCCGPFAGENPEISLLRMRVNTPIQVKNDELATRPVDAIYVSRISEADARNRVADYLNTGSFGPPPPFPAGRICDYTERTPQGTEWKTLSKTLGHNEYSLTTTVDGIDITWIVIVAVTSSCKVTLTAFQAPTYTFKTFVKPDIGPNDPKIIITPYGPSEFVAQYISGGFCDYNSAGSRPLQPEPASGGILSDQGVRYTINGLYNSSPLNITKTYEPGVPVTFSLPCNVNQGGVSNGYIKAVPFPESGYDFGGADVCPNSVNLSPILNVEIEITII